MIPTRQHCASFVVIALLSVLMSACASTAPSDPAAPALAVAKSWQDALVARDFGRALSLVATDFTSPAWRTREDLRFYFEQARDRDYFEPAAAAPEPQKATVTAEQVVIYPVGIRARAGVTVFRLTLALRDTEWKIVSADVEFY